MPAGTSSHGCILRTICETAKTPQHTDGLWGDVLNMMLVPYYTLDQLPKDYPETDYLEAQRTGHFLQDCASYTSICPFTIFTVST